MSTYSASALQTLVRDIGHKAIETWLYWEYQWDRNDSGFYGAGWEGTLPAISGPTGKVRLKWYVGGLTGPNAMMLPGMVPVGDGATDPSGAVYITYELDPWNDLYKPWMDRIEQAFEGWYDLPDPADFSSPLQTVKDAVNGLLPTPIAATPPARTTPASPTSTRPPFPPTSAILN